MVTRSCQLRNTTARRAYPTIGGRHVQRWFLGSVRSFVRKFLDPDRRVEVGGRRTADRLGYAFGMTVVSASTIPTTSTSWSCNPTRSTRSCAISCSPCWRSTSTAPASRCRSAFRCITDTKVSARGVLGPCVRVTGPGREALRAHAALRGVGASARGAGDDARARSARDRGRPQRALRARVVGCARRASRRSSSRRRAAARAVGPLALDRDRRPARRRGARRSRIRRARREPVATDGDVDLLGFSDRKTVPVLK